MARGDDILAKIHPKMMPQVMAQLAAQRSPRAIGFGLPAVAETASSERRTRQRQKKTSLLEERWGRVLAERNPGATIYDQFPLRIGNGSNYYVDYVVITGGRHRGEPLVITAWEVKGPYSRSTGIVKLKAAATRYPWIQFQLVSESANRGWKSEEIFP